MKIELLGETEIRVTRLGEAGFDISGPDDLHFGAMQMFVTSVALCTYSVLAAYGERVEAGTDAMRFGLKWSYAERPHRIGRVDMDIQWPEVPDSRLDAAMRAAATCTLHRTLEAGVEIDTMVSRAG